MKNHLGFPSAMMIAALLFASCSSDDNPVTPEEQAEPDPIVIKTPKGMRIERIRVGGFPEKKPNGSFWDFNPILPLSSRPDLVVTLKLQGGSSNIFRSKTEQDAYYLATYTFTEAALILGGELPHVAEMNKQYAIAVVDDDVTFDDPMWSGSFVPSSLYRKDNAANFNALLTNRSYKVSVSGTWVY